MLYHRLCFNEAIGASFNGCQKLCFTFISRTGKKLCVAVYKRDHYPSYLKKGTTSNQLGRNTRKFVVKGYARNLLYLPFRRSS